jgi:hypothetical protein
MSSRSLDVLTRTFSRTALISAAARYVPAAEMKAAASAATSAAGSAAYAAAEAASVAAEVASAAAGAAYSAAYAVYAASAAAGAAYATYAADAVADANIWKSVTLDVEFLDSAKNHEALLSWPLWPNAVPEKIAAEIDAMRKALRISPDGYGYFLDWYERRLAGRDTGFALQPEQDEEMYRRLVAQEDDWWERAPAQVNADIQSWLDELTPPAIAEPQSDFGLIFRQRANDVFEVDPLAGTDETLDTPEARDRHGHLRDTLSEALQLASGHNQASSLAPRFEKWLDFLRDEPRQMHLGRLLQHAELVLKLADAMAQEIRDTAPLSQLPENSRNLGALLEALPTAHWAMVNFDPALARRSTLHSDPDVPQVPAITISNNTIIITSAVNIGALTAESAEQVKEMGEGLEVQNPDPRRLRRYWETSKNLVRAAGAYLWKQKTKIALGLPPAAISIATFLVKYEKWVLSLFTDSPGMVTLLTQLINWLKQFPFLFP